MRLAIFGLLITTQALAWQSNGVLSLSGGLTINHEDTLINYANYAQRQTFKTQLSGSSLQALAGVGLGVQLVNDDVLLGLEINKNYNHKTISANEVKLNIRENIQGSIRFGLKLQTGVMPYARLGVAQMREVLFLLDNQYDKHHHYTGFAGIGLETPLNWYDSLTARFEYNYRQFTQQLAGATSIVTGSIQSKQHWHNLFVTLAWNF